MHQRRIRETIVLGLIAALPLLGSTACNTTQQRLAISPRPAPLTVIGGAGGTSIAPLMDKWVDAFRQTHPNVEINYRPIGSGAGIEEIKQGYLTFGASDVPLSDTEARNMRRPVIQVPVSGGPVSIVYNLPGISVPLKLTPRNLSDIYLGNIISWQDPAIAKDNPGVRLPRMAIIVLHRSDGGGTTNIFTSYLAKVNPDWSSKVGQGLSVKWPVGLGAVGSQGVLTIVQQTLGTIGYLEASYAKENNIAVASIQNRGGKFVQPSYTSAAAAMDAFRDNLAKDVRSPIVDPPASAVDAYPISGLIFILVPRDRPEISQQEAVQDFIGFAISSGQDAAEALSYAKLPDFVQKQGNGLLGQLTANGQPLPASTCFFVR